MSEEEKITPIVARRMIEDIEIQAAFEWKMAGSPQGQCGKYIDDALRERLAEALAEPEELRAQLKETDRAFENAKEEIERVSPPEGMDDDFKKIVQCGKLARYHEHVIDLLKRLVARCEDQATRLKDEPQVVLVKPLQRAPRPRLGSTTLALPGLAIANDVTIDEPDVPKIEPVKKKGRKSA